MAFMRHIGKHGDRKVAIVYRTVPGEEHMALVIYTETLSRIFHDAIMKIIEGKVGQEEESLADALHRSLMPDGSPMLQTMHKEGKLKKVQTKQIIVTPNATSHVHLDELNKILDGLAKGNEAAKKMDDLTEAAGQHLPGVAPEESSEGALDDAALAATMMAQSKQMVVEGTALVAESKRLEKEAFKLNPALKPKRTVKKKAAVKKKAVK